MPRDSSDKNGAYPSQAQWVGLGALTVLGLGAAWASKRYHVTPAYQFLSKTGPGVAGVHVSRRTFQWPYQEVSFHSLSVRNHAFRIDNLYTKDRVKLAVKVAMAWRPHSPDTDATKAIKYATWLGEDQTHAAAGQQIMTAIEGDLRSDMLAMTAQELLDDGAKFRKDVVERAQERLDEFGIELPLLNIGDLEDAPNAGNYLDIIQKKSRAVTHADAARDVAEAQQREAEETNKRNKAKEESNRDYHVSMAEFRQTRELKDIEVKQEIEKKRIESDQLLSEIRLKEQTALMRAKDMSIQQIAYEKAMLQSKAQADAVRVVAEAQLFKEQQEATAITAKLEAEAKGLERLLSASPEHPEHALKFLMLKNGLFEKLAQTNATAIADMKPTLHLWNTGNGGSSIGADGKPVAGSSTPYDGVRQLFTSLAPIWDVVQNQLDVKFPTDSGGVPRPSTPVAGTDHRVNELAEAIYQKQVTTKPKSSH
jgi:flotillin